MAYPGFTVTQPSQELHITCMPQTTPEPIRYRLCSRLFASQYCCSLFRSASVSNWPAKKRVRSRHSSPAHAGQQQELVEGFLDIAALEADD